MCKHLENRILELERQVASLHEHDADHKYWISSADDERAALAKRVASVEEDASLVEITVFTLHSQRIDRLEAGFEQVAKVEEVKHCAFTSLGRQVDELERRATLLALRIVELEDNQHELYKCVKVLQRKAVSNDKDNKVPVY